MMHLVIQTPPLEHLAAIKIATAMWRPARIMSQIAHRFNNRPASEEMYIDCLDTSVNMPEWKTLVEEVKSNVADLHLPPPCQNQVARLIHPIGEGIFKWCEYYHVEIENFESSEEVLPLPREFCWTMHGTVEHKKTAEVLVKDETLAIEKRYVVACLNCLEDEAGRLLRLLSENQKRELMDHVRENYQRTYGIKLVAYFTCTLSGRLDLLEQILSENNVENREKIEMDLFETAMLYGSRSNCDYFFEKLNPGERELTLSQIMPCANIENYYYQSLFQNLLYFWNLCNAQQRENALRSCTDSVLACLVRWPLQPLFIQMVKYAGQFMNDQIYYELLEVIAESIRNGNANARLFREFWNLIPAARRRRFIDDAQNLKVFFETKDEDIIKMFLDEASARQIEASIIDASIVEALSDEAAICDAALAECAERAARISSDDVEDEEKRDKSRNLRQLVDSAMQMRIKKRNE